MAPSTRHTVSVRLRERQLIETIAALQAVDLSQRDAASVSAITTALVLFQAALAKIQERS